MFVAACWLLVKRTWNIRGRFFCLKLCLFVLFVCFVCFCLVMVYDVWQQYCFFLIFCLHLAFSSIQIEKCFGNCLKRAAKKVRSTTLDWFDLGGRYTYIRVHKNICNQLHTRVKTFWISKGTFEIATKVFKLSGLVISEKKFEMKWYFVTKIVLTYCEKKFF